MSYILLMGLLVGVYLISAAGTAEAVSFSTSTQSVYDVTSRALAHVTVDIDHDGDLDVVVANDSSRRITIFSNNGQGEFTSTTTPIASRFAQSIVAADFNNDGYLDLATGDLETASVITVLFNDGAGNFSQSQAITAGRVARNITTGDFDGDGDVDLALANQSGFTNQTVTLLENNNGVFSVQANIDGGADPLAITSGDYDNDGDVDLVTTNTYTTGITLITNEGAGVWSSTFIAGGAVSFVIVSEDFDNDGYVDLATSDEQSQSFTIYKNNQGVMQVHNVITVSGSPQALTVVDINDDGSKDVVGVSAQSQNVSVMLNDGQGNFATSTDVFVGFSPRYISGGDYDADGDVDLALSRGSNNWRIIIQPQDGPFIPEPSDYSTIAVLATNSIWFKKNAQLLSGDVVVNMASSEQVLNASSSLTLGQGVTSQAGTQLMGESIRLKKNAHIMSDLFYDTLSAHKKSTHSGATGTVALPVFDELPEFLEAEAGTTSITIPRNASTTLAAGAYSVLKVKASSTVTLSGGTYSFSDIVIKKGGQLLVDSATDILISNRLSTNRMTRIAPNEGLDASAENIRIYVAGQDGQTGKPRAIKIGRDSHIEANLYAPYGTVHIKQGSVAEGSFIGRDVLIGKGVTIQEASGW